MAKNVIWIFGDQHPAHALGCNGDPNVSTPHLDRLAGEGQNWERAVAGCPLCCPFRGSLLTSRYPHECVPGHECRMPSALPTLAQVFTANGYDTAWFGKWHLDGFHEREGRAAMHIVPPERRGGFKTWIGYENNNSQWDCWVHGGEGAGTFHYRLPGYETDSLTDLLLEYIAGKARDKSAGREQPFFAVLSVQPPHDPYLAPAEWMQRHTPGTVGLRPNVPPVERILRQARSEWAGAYAMIENLDWNVGRVREALARAGLADDTHILFFSDHGDLHGAHGQFRKTAPWEEAIRVPFIVGGLTPFYGAGTGRQQVLVNHVDVAPTTLGLCGITVPEWMRGADLSGLRLPGRGTVSLPDSAYLQLAVPTRHHDSIDRPWRGVVTHDGWKYAALEGQPWLLFNLNEDPFELVNLAHNTRYAVERHRLNERLRQWGADTGDTFALPAL